MPIVNADSARFSNAGTLANAFEVKVTDPIEGGKEVMGQHGQNAAMPANSDEARKTQEQGTH
jgi:hypothetical protein